MNRPDPCFCRAEEGGVVLTLHVQPRASKNQLCGIQDNALKVRLTSPPVDGAANRLCREFLAELLDVPRSAVAIVSGETSRHKRVRITGDPERLMASIRSLTP